MSPTINYTETLTVVTCTCGINFAIPETLHQQLLDHPGGAPDTKSVVCPLGHRWHFLGKSEAQLERERRQGAERREKAVRDLLRAEERSHSATKGKLTKVKNRVHAGVCPHCNRTFQNLARHMGSKHAEEVAAG